MEDILTSNVFGLLRYVQPQDGILKYLSFAKDRNENLISLNDVFHKSIDYKFWPSWKETNREGCEPDVVISLEIPDGENLLILIEAKYLSGKSSEADESNDKPTDQLAKEWDNLIKKACKQKMRPILIYLTAHYVYPDQDIKESIKEFLDKKPEETKPIIYWLSWRHLHKVCENTDNPILNDLSLLLERLYLKFFDGVKLEEVHIPWFFEKVFGWQKYNETQTIMWRFET